MKYRMRIALCVICFLSVAFGIGGTLLMSVSFSNNLHQEKQTAVNSCQTVLNMLRVVNSVSSQVYYGNIVDVLEQMDDNGGGSWDGLRLSMDGNVIYESGEAAQSFLEMSQVQIVEAEELSLDVSEEARDGQSYDTQEGFYLQVFETEDGHFLQVSGSLEAGEKVLYLDSIYDISSIYEFRNSQQELYRYVFLIIVAVGAALSWIMANLLTKPLQELSRTARRISDGDLAERAHISGEDEIGRLAEDFNHMADELERHIDELQDNVERQEAFMGSFAHELKTPMTAVIGYADLLRSQTLPAEQQREAANYIFSEGKRLENLSLKLLQLFVSKNESMEFLRCQPRKLVADVVQLLSPSMVEYGIVLEQESETGSCLLEPALVTSLLINLIDNARKSMDQGGRILVKTRVDASGCCFMVEDEGCGIPPQEVSRIMDAFYRVDKSRSRSMGGAGLGLALCREIVLAHNGTISFTPREPKGTRVTVWLKKEDGHEES